MPIKLKKLLLTLAAMFTFPLLLFLIAFVSTWGSYSLPATVTDDAALPHLQLGPTRLHSEAFGPRNRPVLVVIHDGPGGDYRSLLPLKALEQDYRVVFYDQRGSGLSERVPESQLTIAQALDDLHQVIRQHSTGRPVSLLGHGWGGMLATAYVGKRPNEVERLILAEPGFLNTALAQQVLPAMNKQSVAFLYQTSISWVRSLHLPAQDADARADFVFQQIRRQPAYECNGKIPANFDQRSWRAGFHAWRTITRSTFDEKGQIQLDFTEGVKRYTRPVLFLVSTCNTLTGRDFQARQARLFAQAALHSIPQSGHDLFLDNPSASVTAVRAFLSSGQLPTTNRKLDSTPIKD